MLLLISILIAVAAFVLLLPVTESLPLTALIVYGAYVVLLLIWGWLGRRWRMVGRQFVYQLLVVGAFFMLLPFYWMIVTSFKDASQALTFPPKWLPVRTENTVVRDGTSEEVEVLRRARNPDQMVPVVTSSEVQFQPELSPSGRMVHKKTWDSDAVFTVRSGDIRSTDVLSMSPVNFVEAWYAPEVSTLGAVNFGQYFWVSVYTGVATTTGTLITSALAAYAFARMRFWGRGLFFYLVLATMMVPGQVLLIPNFIILDLLHWLDTPFALIVPWLASVFTIFLMRQFFMTIPDDLWDAAQIDGSGRFRFLWQVVVPLSKPVFITAGIFTFLGNWNSLLWPLIVTSSPSLRTLMVGLQTFNQEAGSEFHLLMAASSLAILPVVLLFFFLQRFFIQGIARAGLKS